MDNRQLDQYMARLETLLKHVPAAQREENLHEVRQHLHALVARHIAQGHSEVDAVEMALRQFGHAESIGRELASVQQNRRPLWMSIIIYLCIVTVIFAVFVTANDKPTDFPYGWVNQILLAFVLPAGFFAREVRKYLRFN